jgi:hypothetical protein
MPRLKSEKKPSTVLVCAVVPSPSLRAHSSSTMVDGIVPREALADAPVSAKLISHQPAFRVGCPEDNASQRGGGDILNLLRPSASTALDQGNDWHAIPATASLPPELGMENPGGATFLVNGVGLVGLNDLPFSAEWAGATFIHRHPDAMHQKPRGLEAAAEGALNLASRNALLAGANQVDGLKPKMHRDVRRLEDRPHPHRERLPTGTAFPQAGARALAFQLRR